ncbi:MAG: DUF3034 family protein [Planctomycetota bacterium]|jgi:hypothetical protein
MAKITGLFIILGFLVASCSIAEAGETDSSKPLSYKPLLSRPLHNFEGGTGVYLTNLAYLAKPPKEGEIFGPPSISVSTVLFGKVNRQAYAITENIFGNIEVGYSYELFDVGDWADDIYDVTGLRASDEVIVHNFNIRAKLIEEGGFGIDWMPTVTFGTHFKWNDDISKINRQLNGLGDTVGADHSFGTEFTLVASKMVKEGVLPRPFIVSAGLRNGDSIHTGLLGFAGERRTTFEGSLVVFLTDRLMLATEYRQSPDLVDEYNLGGKCLIEGESDWFDVALGYVIDEHMTIGIGYSSTDFGNNILSQDNNVWAFQLKYSF